MAPLPSRKVGSNTNKSWLTSLPFRSISPRKCFMSSVRPSKGVHMNTPNRSAEMNTIYAVQGCTTQMLRLAVMLAVGLLPRIGSLSSNHVPAHRASLVFGESASACSNAEAAPTANHQPVGLRLAVPKLKVLLDGSVHDIPLNRFCCCSRCLPESRKRGVREARDRRRHSRLSCDFLIECLEVGSPRDIIHHHTR